MHIDILNYTCVIILEYILQCVEFPTASFRFILQVTIHSSRLYLFPFPSLSISLYFFSTRAHTHNAHKTRIYIRTRNRFPSTLASRPVLKIASNCHAKSFLFPLDFGNRLNLRQSCYSILLIADEIFARISDEPLAK